MSKLIANWKTTSAGVSAILLAVIHLIFQALNHQADEAAWIVAITAIIGGLGLVAAGDADKSYSVTEAADLKGRVVKAIEQHDTSIITKEH